MKTQSIIWVYNKMIFVGFVDLLEAWNPFLLQKKMLTMENRKMVQKRLWKEKEFRLDDGILHFKEIGLLSGYTVELRYEDIIGERRIKRQPNYVLFIAASILFWLSSLNFIGYGTGTITNVLAPTLGVLMSSLLFYIVYRNAQEVVYLDTVENGSIGFFRDESYKRQADKFITELLEQRKLFLVEKYWDCVDCYDKKMHNLDWLKNENIVNIDEFKHLKDEMFQQIETEVMPIGFHKRKCS
ncbi:MAG: hypothetical protein ACI976_003109 [Aureispira sp.]|jgi:hypothetical protein